MELTIDRKPMFAATGGRPFAATDRAIVFVHGAGLDHSVWMLPTRYFAHRGFTVLAPDLPGHGRSSGPALPSIEALGAWIVEVLAVAGLRRAALVGHSMGSLACLAAAAHAPARVASLALLATACPMAVSAELMKAAADDDHRAFEMIAGWGHGFEAQLGCSEVPGLWMTGSSLRMLERSKPGALHVDLRAVDAYRAGLAVAAKIACRCLVLLGDSDRMTPPANGRALAASIPGARTVMLEACGHLMMAEQPNAVISALAAHLAEGA